MAPQTVVITAATGFYHVIARVAPWALLGPADYARVLGALTDALDRQAAPLVAYSLVPGRCQLLLGPIGPQRLGRLSEWVGRTPEYRALPPPRTMPVHSIADVVPRLRHVERAACTAGLVSRAEAWPWTSLAQRHAGARRPLLIDGVFLHSAAWLDYVNTPLTPAERATDRPPPTVRSA